MERTGDRVERPAGFDLAGAWSDITDSVEELRVPLVARALAEPDVVQVLRWIFGRRVRVGPTGEDGRVEIEVRGHHESLAGELAGLGRRVEVLEPPEVRTRLADLGAELAATYG